MKTEIDDARTSYLARQIDWFMIIGDLRKVYLRVPETLDCVDGGKAAFRKMYYAATMVPSADSPTGYTDVELNRERAEKAALKTRGIAETARLAVVSVHQKMFPQKWAEVRGEPFLQMVHLTKQLVIPMGKI